VNELDSDPRVGPRCQIWLFAYNTGNPLVYSGGLLQQRLRQAVAELDPAGADPALRRMVVVGHSQGGLLAKLAAVDSGTRFWDNVSTTPFAALRVSDETRAILSRSLFVTPLSFVTRVVFVATPHQGSEVAGLLAARLRGLIRWALTLPVTLVGASADVLTASEDPLLRRTLQQGLPRSVDNMSPGHQFIQTLAALPLAPWVTAHSIVAVEGDGPPEEGSDGVVSYRSAHLPGAASERIVRSGHSVQSNPEAIEEIRRILLEHLDGP
jgi:pimeloyl-ACP methyl ester carboxylesterase